jgi:flagellar motor protein MotB
MRRNVIVVVICVSLIGVGLWFGLGKGESEASKNSMQIKSQKKLEQKLSHSEEQTKKAKEALKGQDVAKMKQEAHQKWLEEHKQALAEEKPEKSEMLPLVDDPYKNKVLYFTNGVFLANNDGTSQAVEAGCLVADKSQGAVLFIRDGLLGSTISRDVINAPEGYDKLTVVSYNGNLVSLVSENGKKIDFDAEKGEFVH